MRALPDHEAIGTPAGRLCWTICALLFFATTVNYADRQILGILAPTLQGEIGWSEAQYGLIVTAFQGAYAIGLLGMGRLIDRVGTLLAAPGKSPGKSDSPAETGTEVPVFTS